MVHWSDHSYCRMADGACQGGSVPPLLRQPPGILPALGEWQVGNLRVESPHSVMKSFMLEQSHQVLQEGQLGRPPVNGPGQLLRGKAAQCRDQFLVNVPQIAFQILLGLLQGAAAGLAGEVHLPALDGRDVGGLDVGSMPNLPRQRAELRVRGKIHYGVRQRPQKVIRQPPRVPPRLHPLCDLRCREFAVGSLIPDPGSRHCSCCASRSAARPSRTFWKNAASSFSAAVRGRGRSTSTSRTLLDPVLEEAPRPITTTRSDKTTASSPERRTKRMVSARCS